MRIEITIHPKTGELVLPNHYQRALSAAVWSKLEVPKEKEGRQPKLLTISPLLFQKRENSRQKNKIRLIGKRGTMLISSPLKTLLEKIANMKGGWEIAGNLLDIVEKKFKESPNFEEEMVWKTFPSAGICTKDNSIQGKTGKYIYPKSQMEACQDSLLRSLKTKWTYLHKRDPSKTIRWSELDNPLELEPPKVEILENRTPFLDKIKENSPLHAWAGTIKITGPTAWQRLIWDCGLGSKTGLGYGMMEPSKK